MPLLNSVKNIVVFVFGINKIPGMPGMPELTCINHMDSGHKMSDLGSVVGGQGTHYCSWTLFATSFCLRDWAA
jgi:hypothetical protein